MLGEDADPLAVSCYETIGSMASYGPSPTVSVVDIIETVAHETLSSTGLYYKNVGGRDLPHWVNAAPDAARSADGDLSQGERTTLENARKLYAAVDAIPESERGAMLGTASAPVAANFREFVFYLRRGLSKRDTDLVRTRLKSVDFLMRRGVQVCELSQCRNPTSMVCSRSPAESGALCLTLLRLLANTGGCGSDCGGAEEGTRNGCIVR